MEKYILLFIILMLNTDYTTAQDSSLFRLESGIVITHFQQQIKPEIGDPRGERLVNEFQIGLLVSGSYRLTNFLSAGIFLRVDRGERASAVFDRIEEGRAITENEVGGVYNEFWFGPLLQFNWKYLTAEIGYALIGLRDDDGRRDIPSSTGDNSSSFSTSPLIAWLFTVGGNFPVFEQLDVIIKLEYRNRYYTKRGGNSLFNNVEHGTQSISPIVGLGWRF